MNRRQVLTLLGSAAFGGCLGGTEPGASTTERTTRTTEETTTTAAPDTTTEAATPSAPDLGEPSPSGCPGYGENVPRVVCSPETDAPMAIVPSSESVSLPSGSLSFTLENTTEVPFEVNYYAWRLHKRVEGEWYYVAPGMWPEPLHRLRPDESHTWNVSVASSPPTCEGTCSSSDEYVTIRGLGAGTYAFGVTGRFAEQEYDGSTGFAAQFALEGDPMSLSRTDSVESVEREGDTVVVRMPDRDTTETLTVTRTEDQPEESERVITEQVVRHTPLRNALASFEEGIETVRVENAVDRVHSAIYVDERKCVEYEGETYLVEEKDETTSA